MKVTQTETMVLEGDEFVLPGKKDLVIHEIEEEDESAQTSLRIDDIIKGARDKKKIVEQQLKS